MSATGDSLHTDRRFLDEQLRLLRTPHNLHDVISLDYDAADDEGGGADAPKKVSDKAIASVLRKRELPRPPSPVAAPRGRQPPAACLRR